MNNIECSLYGNRFCCLTKHERKVRKGGEIYDLDYTDGARENIPFLVAGPTDLVIYERKDTGNWHTLMLENPRCSELYRQHVAGLPPGSNLTEDSMSILGEFAHSYHLFTRLNDNCNASTWWKGERYP